MRTTPYKLVYGYDVVFPIEINLQSVLVARQHGLPVDDYWNYLFDKLDELDEERLYAFERIIRQKEIMARTYNRRVRAKAFSEGDLVWKVEKKS